MTKLGARAVVQLQHPLQEARAGGLKPGRPGIASIRHSGFVIL
jgi:hypothetical protein